MKNINMEFMQEYIFHKNPYTNLWAAFKREDSVDYFNNTSTEKAVKHADINALVDYLIRIHNQK